MGIRLVWRYPHPQYDLKSIAYRTHCDPLKVSKDLMSIKQSHNIFIMFENRQKCLIASKRQYKDCKHVDCGLQIFIKIFGLGYIS